jgi:hypothetical protein
MPLTTAALDQITRPIVTALYPRRYGLKNRERLNRLLILLQLHVNGGDDVQSYASTIPHLAGSPRRSPDRSPAPDRRSAGIAVPTVT